MTARLRPGKQNGKPTNGHGTIKGKDRILESERKNKNRDKHTQKKIYIDNSIRNIYTYI